MKRCSKCKEYKDEEEFPWKYKALGIRHSECRDCCNKYNAGYYERTKDDRLDYKNERLQEARERARKFVWDYLSYHVCEDCREYDPMILTFHHVRGQKKMDISQMVNQGYSIEAIREEIEKCVVLCHNCHARRHKKERGTKYWLF